MIWALLRHAQEYLETEMAQSTRATLALKAAQISHMVHRYDYDGDAPSIGLQAAEALGVPVGTVRSRLNRVRRRLDPARRIQAFEKQQEGELRGRV